RQERECVDGVDGDRPGDAAEHQNRRDDRLSAAALDQYPQGLCRQFNDTRQLLGGQQRRRLDHQGRSAGLTGTLRKPEEELAKKKAGIAPGPWFSWMAGSSPAMTMVRRRRHFASARFGGVAGQDLISAS